MRTSIGKLRYHGEGWALFGLVIVNALFTVLTLGIYSFWAKTKVRQYHHAHTEFDSDPFGYHGTGRELFVGALKASVILVILSLGFAAAGEMRRLGTITRTMQLGIMSGLYLAVVLLTVVAVNGARRYRWSRSSWRGIRFSFHGRWHRFLGLILSGTLLSVVTLGFYTPWFQSKRRAFLVRNSRFGSEPFVYDGKGGPLFTEYLKALILTPLTLGLSWIWYAAFKHRYLWEHTTMRGARFRCSATGGELFALWLTNALIVLLTAGIAMPWAITRSHAFWCSRLMLHGTVDWAAIERRAQTATATGDALAEGLDVALGLAG